MNSNLYTASKKFCLHVLTYFLVLNLLISLGTAAPAKTDLTGITPGQGRTEVIQKKMFLRTKSQRALEILEDGTVQGTACGHNTKFSLLQSGSHNLGNTVFGIAAKRYLCVAPDGVVYSLPMKDFNEDDCVFNETVEYETSGNKSHPIALEYSRYRHKKHGILLGKSVRKYQLALVCNKAVTISMKRHRKKYQNETLFLVEKTDKDLDSLKENCDEPSKSDLICVRKEKCSEKLKNKNKSTRSYVKFCRKVMKNFFSATLRQLRLFRKRDCYSVLKAYKDCQKDRQRNRPS